MSSSLKNTFRTSDPKSKTKTKRPAPLSLRLSVYERAMLEEHAAGTPLGSYIKSRLFTEDNAPPRKTRGKTPVKDYQALAKVLGALAALNIFGDINTLLNAADTGKIKLKPETERTLQKAGTDVIAMRRDLIRALGLKVED